jgi:hypothetical protein
LLTGVVLSALLRKDSVSNFEVAMRYASVAGCVPGTIKLLHRRRLADRAKERSGHLSTLRPMHDTRKKQTRVALTGVSGGQTC